MKISFFKPSFASIFSRCLNICCFETEPQSARVVTAAECYINWIYMDLDVPILISLEYQTK